jgi:hypothetical protein
VVSSGRCSLTPNSTQNFGCLESVRGVNTSRPHGAQGDQFVFQRMVVRWWLECATRWGCRNGICRIVLVFASPGARAADPSWKAGIKVDFSKMFATTCLTVLPTVTCIQLLREAATNTFSPARSWENIPTFSYLTVLVRFHQPYKRQNAICIGARPNTQNQLGSTFSRQTRSSVVTGAAVIIHHE